MNPYLNEDLDIIAEHLNKNGFGGESFLVTGATGLLGSLIVKSFIRYNKTYAQTIKYMAIARSENKARQIFGDDYISENFIFQDITDEIQKETVCDYIIHTACPTVSSYMVSNPVETANTIVNGTRQVLDFAKKGKIKAMVYLSSMEVFGQCVNQHGGRTEQELGFVDLSNVRSCYPEGKRMAECLCKCYADEYDVNVKIARLAQVFGAGILPGENRVFAQFARSASRRENIILHTAGESIGNYCYTRDAIKAIFLLLKNGDSGEAYTVVNEKMTMAIKDMAQLVVDEISDGVSQVIFDIPESNLYGYAPQTRMYLSGAKMRSLGWEPTIGMIEAYNRMIPSL